MATFDINIDTTPIAREVDGISNHVQATTGAVVAMQAAVIDEETKAADRICTNVNKGFYTLIKSQISQKIAKLQSDVDAHIMELNNQKKALMAIKGRMEKDYRMISGRYHKLFTSLNINLRNRIHALDTPLMSLADKENNRISNRRKQLASTVPLSQSEPVAISQTIVASNAKANGARVIDIVKTYIKALVEQELLTKDILHGKEIAGQKAKTVYAPVVVRDMVWSKNTAPYFDIIVPEFFQNRIKNQITNKAQADINDIQWQRNDKNNAKVAIEFEKHLAQSASNDRIKKIAAELFGKNEFATIKNTAE